MVLAGNDSDEEWSKIADVVTEFEQQYIAANKSSSFHNSNTNHHHHSHVEQNTSSVMPQTSGATHSAIPTSSSIPNNPNINDTLTPVPAPAHVIHPPNNNHSNHYNNNNNNNNNNNSNNGNDDHMFPQHHQQLQQQQQQQQQQVCNPLNLSTSQSPEMPFNPNVNLHMNGNMNGNFENNPSNLTSNYNQPRPRQFQNQQQLQIQQQQQQQHQQQQHQQQYQHQQQVHVPPSTTNDSDPYTLALAEKDRQLEQLRTELSGVQSNFRNKLRTMQDELVQARRQAKNSSEMSRLNKEVEIARSTVKKYEDNLTYMQQEIDKCRDKEKVLLAAMKNNNRTGEKNKKQQHTYDVENHNPNSSFKVIPVPALTQPEDVVGPTQAPYPTSSNHSNTNKTYPSSVVKAPNRRKRKSSLSNKRKRNNNNNNTQSQMLPTQIDHDYNDNNKQNSHGSIDEAIIFNEKYQHGWGINLKNDEWIEKSIRKDLFNNNKAGKEILCLSWNFGHSQKNEIDNDEFIRLIINNEWNKVLMYIIENDVILAEKKILRLLVSILTFSKDARMFLVSPIMTGDDDNKNEVLIGGVLKRLEMIGRLKFGQYNHHDHKTHLEMEKIARLCLRILMCVIEGLQELENEIHTFIMNTQPNGNVDNGDNRSDDDHYQEIVNNVCGIISKYGEVILNWATGGKMGSSSSGSGGSGSGNNNGNGANASISTHAGGNAGNHITGGLVGVGTGVGSGNIGTYNNSLNGYHYGLTDINGKRKSISGSNKTGISVNKEKKLINGDVEYKEEEEEEEEENDDNDDEFGLMRTGQGSVESEALRLTELVISMLVERSVQTSDEMWGFVERGYEVVADLLLDGNLNNGRNNESCAASLPSVNDIKSGMECGLGMMSSAAIHAPYLVTDYGGIEGMCSALGRLLWYCMECNNSGDSEDECMLSMIKCIVEIMLMTCSSMGGKLEVHWNCRSVGLGVLATIGWPRNGLAKLPNQLANDEHLKENCRKVWTFLKHRTKCKKTSSNQNIK